MNKNSPDDQLRRLLDVVQKTDVPVPQPSAWFEQRMLIALRAKAQVNIEGKFIFRILAGAALCMIVSVVLPLMQSRNPYMETLAQINKTVQTERLR